MKSTQESRRDMIIREFGRRIFCGLGASDIPTSPTYNKSSPVMDARAFREQNEDCILAITETNSRKQSVDIHVDIRKKERNIGVGSSVVDNRVLECDVKEDRVHNDDVLRRKNNRCQKVKTVPVTLDIPLDVDLADEATMKSIMAEFIRTAESQRLASKSNCASSYPSDDCSPTNPFTETHKDITPEANDPAQSSAFNLNNNESITCQSSEEKQNIEYIASCRYTDLGLTIKRLPEKKVDLYLKSAEDVTFTEAQVIIKPENIKATTPSVTRRGRLPTRNDTSNCNSPMTKCRGRPGPKPTRSKGGFRDSSRNHPRLNRMRSSSPRPTPGGLRRSMCSDRTLSSSTSLLSSCSCEATNHNDEKFNSNLTISANGGGRTMGERISNQYENLPKISVAVK